MKNLSVKELEQLFLNKFDCYSDNSEPAITKEKFIEIMNSLKESGDEFEKNIDDNDELFSGFFEGACPHNNIHTGHHPDQPYYCLDCGEDL
jgi:hypothetical protein